MGARLQADIQSGKRQQRSVFHRSNRVDLCMSFPTTHMIAFADYFPAMHDDRPYHRIGRRVADAILCQLDATGNILLIYSGCIHKKTTFAACKK